MKQRKIRKTPAPCLSVEIKKLIWERDGVKREAICSNDENDWENFKAIKNLVNYRIPDNKKQYYNSLFLNNVGRTKETWSSINSLLNKTKSSTNIQKIVQDGIKITQARNSVGIWRKHDFPLLYCLITTVLHS